MILLRAFRRGTVLWCCFAFLASLGLARTALAQSDAPLHYYDSAIGKTGAALKTALQSIIKNHTVVPYTATATDTWDALKTLDESPANSLDVVLVYSGFLALKSDQFDGQTGSWDREHLWPQSYGIIARSGSSRAKSDLFNLRPIDPSVNSSRGNKYYDYSTPPVSTYPKAPGSSADSNSWEPRDADKGLIARALFYMAVRYDGSDADVPDLELSDTPSAAQYSFGKLSTALAWHRQFSVDLPERARNQRIYTDYQHNRNPFIDYPEYAEMVFLGVSPEQAWEDTRFSDAEQANPAIGAETADPDGDGLRNLLEYTFEREPWQADAAPAVTETVVRQGSTSSIFLSYPHNRNATDVALTYEWTSNLQTWTAVMPSVVSVVVISSETEQVTVSFPASTSGYFVRLRATKS